MAEDLNGETVFYNSTVVAAQSRLPVPFAVALIAVYVVVGVVGVWSCCCRSDDGVQGRRRRQRHNETTEDNLLALLDGMPPPPGRDEVA